MPFCPQKTLFHHGETWFFLRKNVYVPLQCLRISVIAHTLGAATIPTRPQKSLFHHGGTEKIHQKPHIIHFISLTHS